LILPVGAVALIVGVIGLIECVSVPGPGNASIGCGLVQDSSAAQQAETNSPASLPIINRIVPGRAGARTPAGFAPTNQDQARLLGFVGGADQIRP
jgi:hypothetical protein